MAIQYKDPQRDKWALAGFIMGDFTIYKKIAEDCKGDVKTIQDAARKRQFEGTVDSNGTLTYMGATINWQDLGKMA
jgi:hypothetical protein